MKSEVNPWFHPNFIVLRIAKITCKIGGGIFVVDSEV